MARSSFKKKLFGFETLEDGLEDVSLKVVIQVRGGEGLLPEAGAWKEEMAQVY